MAAAETLADVFYAVAVATELAHSVSSCHGRTRAVYLFAIPGCQPLPCSQAGKGGNGKRGRQKETIWEEINKMLQITERFDVDKNSQLRNPCRVCSGDGEWLRKMYKATTVAINDGPN